MIQSQISRRLPSAAALAQITAILSREHFASRRALGRRICETFAFCDARGRPQRAGGMKARAALAARHPEITLPPPQATALKHEPRRRDAPVPPPGDVPQQRAAIEGPLEHDDRSRESPRAGGLRRRPTPLPDGRGPWLAGGPRRRGCRSRVRARDHWIGGDDAQRRARRGRVVCLNRFLIRPLVRGPIWPPISSGGRRTSSVGARLRGGAVRTVHGRAPGA